MSTHAAGYNGAISASRCRTRICTARPTQTAWAVVGEGFPVHTITNIPRGRVTAARNDHATSITNTNRTPRAVQSNRAQCYLASTVVDRRFCTLQILGGTVAAAKVS